MGRRKYLSSEESYEENIDVIPHSNSKEKHQNIVKEKLVDLEDISDDSDDMERKRRRKEKRHKYEDLKNLKDSKNPRHHRRKHSHTSKSREMKERYHRREEKYDDSRHSSRHKSHKHRRIKKEESISEEDERDTNRDNRNQRQLTEIKTEPISESEDEMSPIAPNENRTSNHTSPKIENASPVQVRVKTEVPDGTPPLKNDGSEKNDKVNFSLSGKLTDDVNMYNGVVIKYSQPPEARKPKRRWRWYIFKGDQELPFLPLHRQSAYLIGRERKVADIPTDHPSCSKQHAVLQYRLVSYARDDGSSGRTVKPYILDLGSANGTYVNNRRIDAKRYIELLEKDVVKFGYSSREYVLLHEASKGSDGEDQLDASPELSPYSLLRSN